MIPHDPLALALAAASLLVILVGFMWVLCMAAAYGDEIAQDALHGPQAANALDEFGDNAGAVIFDFPDRHTA